MSEVREQLAKALQDGKVRVRTEIGGAWITGYVYDGDAVAAWLLSALGEMTPTGLDDGPRDVSLADIAGTHVDTELALMAAILHGMEQLDRDARQRIRNWVDERFVPRRPADPF